MDQEQLIKIVLDMRNELMKMQQMQQGAGRQQPQQRQQQSPMR
jgi:hypothetical protein